MASQNSVITQLVADFGKMKTDVTALTTGVAAFITLVQNFINSAQSGGGTTLSADDAKALQDMDAAADALDAVVTQASSSIAAVNVPAPPATS